MLKIGQFNKLQITREMDFGFFLDSRDKQWGEILLPLALAPRGCVVEDWLNVFIYFDSEDRIIATVQRPHAVVGEFNLLRVAAIEKVGAFLDWGLQKDLLVPFGEQKIRLQAGRSYIVRVYQDTASGRIVASTRLDRFLNQVPAEYETGEAVELLIATKTDLGYKAIINDAHWGVLYANEVFTRLRVGQKLRGYIKKLRSDGKIDLALTSTGYEKIDGIAQTILTALTRSNGFLPITAKTSPDEIYDLFGVSKKNYKKAVGALYKQRLVLIEADGIKLGQGTPERDSPPSVD